MGTRWLFLVQARAGWGTAVQFLVGFGVFLSVGTDGTKDAFAGEDTTACGCVRG